MDAPFYAGAARPSLQVSYRTGPERPKSKSRRYEIIISNNSGTIDTIRGKIINKNDETRLGWAKRMVKTKVLRNYIQIKPDKNTRVLVNIRQIAKHTGLKPKEIKQINQEGFFVNFPNALNRSKVIIEKSEVNYIKKFKNSPILNRDLLRAYEQLPAHEKAREYKFINVCITEYERDGNTHLLLTLEGDEPQLPSDSVKVQDHNAIIWHWDKKLYVDSQDHAKGYDKEIEPNRWEEINKNAEKLKQLCGKAGVDHVRVAAMKTRSAPGIRNAVIPVTDPDLIKQLAKLDKAGKFSDSQPRYGFIVADRIGDPQKNIHLVQKIQAGHVTGYSKPFFNEVAIHKTGENTYSLSLKSDAVQAGKKEPLEQSGRKIRERGRLEQFCGPGHDFESVSFPTTIPRGERLRKKTELKYIDVIKNSPLRNPVLLDAYNALPKAKKAQPNDCISVRVFAYRQDGQEHCKLLFDEAMPDMDNVEKGFTYNALIWNLDGKPYLGLREQHQFFGKTIDPATRKKVDLTAEKLRQLSGNVGE